jgi:hypothetical protein
MALIPGIDYMYDTEDDNDLLNAEMLKDNFKEGSTRWDIHSSLWDYLDMIIDDCAKCDGIVAGYEGVFESMEDFCIECDIPIPPLYRYIFDARGGFLTQAKSIRYISDIWNETFTEVLPQFTIKEGSTIMQHKEYLEKLPESKREVEFIKSYLKL